MLNEQVIVVGAGIAGIAASVLISKKVRNVTVDVYERRSKVVSML
jgi:protoporphyrinogen oxidase